MEAQADISVDLTKVSGFASYFFQEDMEYPFPHFHDEMYELAQAGHNRIAIAAPRSFAKSTVFSKIYTLFLVCQGDVSVAPILLLSNTGALAEHWLREIKRELERNIWLRSKFGDLRTDKWTQDHIVCKRKDGTEIEVMAKGAGYQIRGFRPGTVVVDDIETDEMVRSEDQRAKLKDWFDKALINTLEKTSQLIMIGTIIHPMSLLGNVMSRDGWISKTYKAILPDATSLWPEKCPMDALMARKREIGTLAFNSEFQNEPIISENPVFFKTWFKPYEANSSAFIKEKAKGVYTIIACDPAISQKETADYTAIVTISATFDPEPKYYIRPRGVIRGHWPINRQVSELVRLYDLFKAKGIVIETVAYQEALAQEVRRYMSDHRRHIPIIEVKPDRDKVRRAYAVGPYFERGQVYADFTDEATEKLVEECLVFPTGDRDDYVDAMCLCMDELISWTCRKNVGKIKSALDTAGW